MVARFIKCPNKIDTPSRCIIPIARKFDATAGKVLLNGINPNGIITSRAARINDRSLKTTKTPEEANTLKRCGLLTFSSR